MVRGGSSGSEIPLSVGTRLGRMDGALLLLEGGMVLRTWGGRREL